MHSLYDVPKLSVCRAGPVMPVCLPIPLHVSTELVMDEFDEILHGHYAKGE